MFVEAIQEEDVTRFVFVDETRTNLTYCRRYGRAPVGRRLNQAMPLRGGPDVTLIAALTPDGLGALLRGDGAVNGNVFAAYLDKVAGLAELVEARGTRLLYLPSYSPDFNPIALAFSKLKTWLRTAQARTRESLVAVIQTATGWITERDAKNGFDQCGYLVH